MRLTEKPGKQGDEDNADQRDTAARHELLDTLGLRAGVVVTVAFEQVDTAPNTETGTEGDNEGLQYIDCTVEKIHNVSPESNGIENACCTPDCKIRNENRCVRLPIPASPFKF